MKHLTASGFRASVIPLWILPELQINKSSEISTFIIQTLSLDWDFRIETNSKNCRFTHNP